MVLAVAVGCNSGPSDDKVVAEVVADEDVAHEVMEGGGADELVPIATWSCKCGLVCGQPDGTAVESFAEFLLCWPGDKSVASVVAGAATKLCNEEMLAQGCAGDGTSASSCMCVFVVDYCETTEASE